MWKTFFLANLKEGPIKVGLGLGYYHARPAFAGLWRLVNFNLGTHTVDFAKEHSRCILGALLQLRP